MAKKRKGRPVDGVLILNKPKGISSNAALQKARWLYFAQKGGHTGSLDPMATGVLPICLGESTKFSQWGLDADKRYLARVRLGVATRTGDAEGEVIQSVDASHISEKDIERILPAFRGEIAQIPSMFSALKYQGTPLYELARKGVEVEREPRRVHIFELEMSNFSAGNYVEFDIDVHCSKGTYIRTLAEDMGIALGIGAHLIALHRTAAGCFKIEQAKSLAELEAFRGEAGAEILDTFLLPADATIQHLPRFEIDPHSTEFFLMGQSVMVPGIYRVACEESAGFSGPTGSRFIQETDIVRVFCKTGDFLGVAEVTDDSQIQPKRVVVRH